MGAMANDSGERQFYGEWWLPAEPERRVPGVLSFSQQAGGVLKLIGRLGALGAGGMALGNAGDRAVTLLDCRTRSLQRSTPQVHTLSVGQIVSGIWFDAGEPIEFDRCTVHLRHLTEWSGVDGLSELQNPWVIRTRNVLRDDGSVACELIEDEKYAIEDTEHPPVVIALAGGQTLRLHHLLTDIADPPRSFGVRQEVVAEIESPQLVPLVDLVNLISDFQRLVSICCGRPAAINSVTLMHPSAPIQSLAGVALPDSRDDLEYITRWATVDRNPEPLDVRTILLAMNQVGGPDGIREWLGVAEQYRDELRRVLHTRWQPNRDPYDAVVALCSCLEAVDRRWRGDTVKDLRVRLRRLAAFVDPAFAQFVPAESRHRWLQIAVQSRKYAAHHLGAVAVTPSPELHWLSESLYWVFVLVLLKLAGVNEKALLAAAQHHTLERVRRSIQAVFREPGAEIK